MIIRQATDDDSSSISKLIFDIWINEYGFDVKYEDYPDIQNINQYYNNKGGIFLVAVIESKVIGTIAYSRLYENVYILRRMFVHKSHRRKGVAQFMLDQLFKHINHSAVIYLSTTEGIALAAKQLYLSNDFSVINKNE